MDNYSSIDYDGTGTQKTLCTAWTLVVYEQEFHADMIKDVFGVIDAKKTRIVYDDDGTLAKIDYTNTNWHQNMKALWAMLKTYSDVAFAAGDLAPNERVKPYFEWVCSVGKVNLDEIAAFVIDEMNAGLFRDAAADSRTTSSNE